MLSVIHVYCSGASETRFHSLDIYVGVIEILETKTFNTVLVNKIDARVLRATNKTYIQIYKWSLLVSMSHVYMSRSVLGR